VCASFEEQFLSHDGTHESTTVATPVCAGGMKDAAGCGAEYVTCCCNTA
jgi:hypothetical protein